MPLNVARRAYSAEQLLALRHSASDEAAGQIEANAEGSIKDHVVRNSRSFAARSTRSLNASETLRPPSIEESRPYTAPVLCEIDPNNQTLRPGVTLGRLRPSPTPSMKKRKAEQILKHHGSPPGLRVTAGGRIVPSDQSPLCSPRYGYSAIKKNGMLIKFGPNYPPPLSTINLPKMNRNLPNGFVAQDPGGRFVQMVNSQFLPVNEINGIPQLYIAAPNLNGFPLGEIGDAAAGNTPFDNAVHRPLNQGRDEGTSGGPSVKQSSMKPPAVSTSMQIQALEKQYSKLEQESRDLDKVEVLQRSTMSSKAYGQLVQKRRELVGRLNEIRVSLKALRDAKLATEQSPNQREAHPTHPPFGMLPYNGQPVMPPPGPLPDWSFDGIAPEAHSGAPFPGAPGHPEFGFFVPPGAFPGPLPPYPGMFGPIPPMYNMMGVPPADTFNGFMPNPINVNPQIFPSGSSPVPRLEPQPEADLGPRRAAAESGSVDKDDSRRSHALEIKHPEVKLESTHKSALNPMSPSYQPSSINAKASTPASKVVPPFAGSPSPALAEAVRAHNAWIGDSANMSNSAGSQRKLRYESSASSYATADFFPNNPRDHSTKKEAYPAVENRPTGRAKPKEERPQISNDQPVTPEHERHNHDWNPAIPDAAFERVTTPSATQEAIAAPSGRPDIGDASYKADPVRDRSEINVSPKNRRPDYLMNFKPVSEVATLGSGTASPATGQIGRQAQTQRAVPLRPGHDHGATAYMEGFRAGESRLPIGPERVGVWLDGYCAGLLKSNQPSSDGKSIKQKTKDHTEANIRAPQRPVPAVHINSGPVDTLKEAMFSSQNENALLTPDPSGPLVDDMGPMDHSNWTKTHDAAPMAMPDILAQMRNGEVVLPERTSSVVQRQLSGQGPTMAGESSRLGEVLKGAEQGRNAAERRTTSSQSQPSGSSPSSYLQRAYPGHRVLSSQLEWKSGSSIAQVAGLATGYFAQYDGTNQVDSTLNERQPLTQVSGNAGMTTHDAPSKAMAEKQVGGSPVAQGRFVEATMTGDEQSGSVSSSPAKKSPAKVKFAQIAGKAGIKVRNESKEENEGDMSPHERRRWRDVWKKRFTDGREGEKGEPEQGGRQ